MQSKRLKTLIVVALSAVAVVFGCFGIINSNKTQVQAQTVEINNVLESKIALNTEVDISSSITVEYNGTHTAKNGVVVFPDGKIVNAGKIKLNQAGEYQIKYFFDYVLIFLRVQ